MRSKFAHTADVRKNRHFTNIVVKANMQEARFSKQCLGNSNPIKRCSLYFTKTRRPRSPLVDALENQVAPGALEFSRRPHHAFIVTLDDRFVAG